VTAVPKSTSVFLCQYHFANTPSVVSVRRRHVSLCCQYRTLLSTEQCLLRNAVTVSVPESTSGSPPSTFFQFIMSFGTIQADVLPAPSSAPANKLAACSTVPSENLTVPQLVKKFSAFCKTQMFITMFTTARHLFLIQPIAFRPISFLNISCNIIPLQAIPCPSCPHPCIPHVPPISSNFGPTSHIQSNILHPKTFH
jgi:hypothetical protein